MPLSKELGLAALVATLAACAPTVNVATREPIVIQLNIQHELRVKIEREVDELIESDEARGQVGTRGLGEDVSASFHDAREVTDAKRAGSIGERADGYLGVVRPDADPELDALVERVNRERRESYQALADEYETSLVVVGTIAGEQRLASAAPGEAVMTADGRWVQKPGS